MVQFRSAEREIQFKVVYYGPALGGKTTSLEALHEITDPTGNTQLVSLKTAEDRTLFFDFLPFELGEIEGYKVRLHLYTVPGQVHYNTTRKVVLVGSDAVVFVADSQETMAKENYISWENMKANLLANKIPLDEIPIIIQCNKQDLPEIITVDEILREMKVRGCPAFPSCALTGEGVVETFVRCLQETLKGFVVKFGLDRRGVDAARLDTSVSKVFRKFLDRERKVAAPSAAAPLQAQVPLHGLSEEEQLIAALESSTKLAEQYQEAQLLSRKYQQRLREMTTLYQIGTQLALAESVRDALTVLPELVTRYREGWAASTFIADDGQLHHVETEGLEEDPLQTLSIPDKGPLASIVLKTGVKEHIADLPARLQKEGAVAPSGLSEALLLPLREGAGSLGHLAVYLPQDEEVGPEEDRFFTLLTQLVVPRLMAIQLMEELALANETLEIKVIERTAELQLALSKLTEVDQLKQTFLNNISHEVRTPLTNIMSYVDILMRYPDQDEKQREEYLEIVVKESAHLERLLDDLLSYSRVKKPFSGEPIDLREVLEDTLVMLGPAMAEKHVEPKLQANREILAYPMNREDAGILFRHVLDNAVKFSPEGVKIKIYLLEDPRKIVFAVRDYGAGFPEEHRERLMEPFEQGIPEVGGAKRPGMGMGLYLAKEVLHKYGGTIHIENMYPGTNVVVEFPQTGQP